MVAVAEPVRALREAVAGTYAMAAYESVGQLLDAGGIDGVLIVTPSPTHLEMIEVVASAGIAILCEKPCGLDPDDTRRAVWSRRRRRGAPAGRLLASIRARACGSARPHR